MELRNAAAFRLEATRRISNDARWAVDHFAMPDGPRYALGALRSRRTPEVERPTRAGRRGQGHRRGGSILQLLEHTAGGVGSGREIESTK